MIEHGSSKVVATISFLFIIVFLVGMGYLVFRPSNASGADIKHDSNAIMFISTLISFIVSLILMIIKVLSEVYDKKIISSTVIIYVVLIFVSILTTFIVLNFVNPDEEIGRAISVIFKYYEDISIISIMQFVLLGLYSILKSKDRAHESYLLFMALFVIGTIRLLLLLLKSDFTLWSFWNWDADEIDKEILDKIRLVDGVEKNYECKDGKPNADKNPISCENDIPVINNENTMNETNRHYNTLFWVKFYYYALIGVSVVSIFVSILEFIHTYHEKVVCISGDELVGSPIETSTGTNLTYKKKSKEKPAPVPKTE